MKFFLIKLAHSCIPYFLNKKIIKLPLFNESDVGISTFIGHDVVEMFIVSLSSLFYQLNFSLPVYIVDDGTLTSLDKKKLSSFFRVEFENSQENSGKIKALFKKYPLFLKYRFDSSATVFRKKFDSILLCPFKKIVYLDSDIHFFKKPTQIIHFIKGKKNASLYSCRSSKILYQSIPVTHSHDLYFRRLLFLKENNKIDPTFNSGLMCFENKNNINLKRLEEILKLFYQIGYVYSWSVEEVLFSFLFSELTNEALNPFLYSNASTIEEYSQYLNKDLVSMHYTGNQGLKTKFKSDAIKHFFWGEYSKNKGNS